MSPFPHHHVDTHKHIRTRIQAYGMAIEDIFVVAPNVVGLVLVRNSDPRHLSPPTCCHHLTNSPLLRRRGVSLSLFEIKHKSCLCAHACARVHVLAQPYKLRHLADDGYAPVRPFSHDLHDDHRDASRSCYCCGIRAQAAAAAIRASRSFPPRKRKARTPREGTRRSPCAD